MLATGQHPHPMLWQDKFGVKPGSQVSKARLRPARHRAGHRLAYGDAQTLQEPLPKCLGPRCFLSGFSHTGPSTSLSSKVTQLHHTGSWTQTVLHLQGGERGCRAYSCSQVSLIFSESGAVFSGAYPPQYCGVRGIFCTLFSKVEKRWFKGELWSEYRVMGTTAIHSKQGKCQHQEQLNGRFVWVFYYSLWIFAWYCFLYSSDINKTKVTALTSIEFGFDSVQLR